MCFAFAAQIAIKAEAEVIAADYRVAPENPFPAAYEDGLAIYSWLVGPGGFDPKKLSVVADSAGAGLSTAALMGARDRGLPMPAALVAISPLVDLTLSSASLDDQSRDPWIQKELCEFMVKNYIGDGDARDPRCSPIYGDLTGLPPMYITGGQAEILYDDQVQLAETARKAGVDVTFESWKHMIHIFPIFVDLPESQVLIERIAEFLIGQTNLE